MLVRFVAASGLALFFAWAMVAVELEGERLGIHAWRGLASIWQRSAPARADAWEAVTDRARAAWDWANEELHESRVSTHTPTGAPPPASEPDAPPTRVSALQRARQALPAGPRPAQPRTIGDRPASAQERALLDQRLKP
jgi:hypothetical protein